MEKTCKTCNHSRQWVDDDGKPLNGVVCHAGPPTRMPTSTVFPVCNPAWWCASWRSRNPVARLLLKLLP